MTFTIIEKDNARYTIDIEDMNELLDLAEKHGWATMNVDMWNLTITIQ